MSDSNRLLWCDRTARERLRLLGPDRVKFLHNYCTNDIKTLAIGSGREAFVTSPQGKTSGYLSVFADENELLLRTDPGGFSLVLPHFAKYGVFDEVTWEDVRESTFEIHITGDAVEDLLSRLELPIPGPPDLHHLKKTDGGRKYQIVRESPFGTTGFSLIGSLEDRDSFLSAMQSCGGTSLHEMTSEESEWLRIQAGTPVFGRDISPENLPQEIGRDRLAISFVKGCYLGQETVARLDALGHVNKLLMILEVTAGDPPAPGDALVSQGQPAGTVTSSARSSALALVRVKNAPPGAVVSWDTDGRRGEAIASSVPGG